MPVDQKEIAINACYNVVRNASKLLAALDELESINEQLVSSGIDIANYITDIESDSRIKHCESSTFKNILSAFTPHIVTELKAYYDGSPTQQGWVAFQKARIIQNSGMPL